jgi:hypothetical protein
MTKLADLTSREELSIMAKVMTYALRRVDEIPTALLITVVAEDGTMRTLSWVDKAFEQRTAADLLEQATAQARLIQLAQQTPPETAST